MARHRIDDKDNEQKWGGPDLAERHDGEPRRHRRDGDKTKTPETDEPAQPPQR